MSNELNTPKILSCPAESDSFREQADTFDSAKAPPSIPFTSNSNLSYFVGLGVAPTNAMMFLAGDHNLTNGATVKPGVLDLSTNRPPGWTGQMHYPLGNVALANGSVQTFSTRTLPYAIGQTGFATNRLSMP